MLRGHPSTKAIRLVGKVQRRQRRRGRAGDRVVDVNVDHSRERRGIPAPRADNHVRPELGPGQQRQAAGCFNSDALERVLTLPFVLREGEQLCWHPSPRRSLAQCQPVPLICRRRYEPLAAVTHDPLRQGRVVPDLLLH